MSKQIEQLTKEEWNDNNFIYRSETEPISQKISKPARERERDEGRKEPCL